MRRIVGLVALTFAIVIVVGFVAPHVSPERAAAAAERAGPLALVVYVVAFALLQPLGLSAHVFVLAAVVLWPPWVAFGVGLTGAVLAAIVAFVVARYLARDAIQARLPERVRKYEDRLVEGGAVAVFVVRVLTFTTVPVMYLMGVARISFSTMLLGTIPGLAPGVALDVLIGRGLLEWLFGWG